MVDIVAGNKSLRIFGNGEMIKHINAYDWGATELGSIDTWPDYFINTLNILLNNNHPQLLFFGPELRCFYNDAMMINLEYSGKHPLALGMKAHVAFPDNWAFFLQNINDLKDGKKVPVYEDMLMQTTIKGKLQQGYWTFSFNAVYNMEGVVEGVLINSQETTQKVLALKEAHNKSMHLQLASDVAKLGVWEFEIATGTFTANQRMQTWLGLEPAPTYLLDEGFKNVEPESVATIREALAKSLSSGTDIEFGCFTQASEARSRQYLYSTGTIILDEEGKPKGFSGTTQNLTNWIEKEKLFNETESRFHVMADNISQLAWMADASGFIFWYNKRWFDYTGTTLEEMQGWGWKKVHHPEHVDRVVKRIQHSWDTGEDWEDTFPLKGKDGIYRWFLSRAKAIKDKDGNVLQWFGTNTDVTREKQYENELRDRERQFRLLANSMPQFVWTATKEGVLNYFNQAVFDYSGMTKDEILAKGWLEIVHPEERDDNVTQWLASINSGSDFFFEHRFRRFDGEYRWQLSRAKPQRDAEGNIQMWVGTSTDIHEMKVLEKQKDYFISVASHELKTPITSLKGHLQMVQESIEQTESPEINYSLQTMERQVNKLSRLINDLLDVSRIQSGTLVTSSNEFEMQDLVTEIVEENKALSKQHKLVIEELQPVTVMADRVRIGQVITNLLNNAIKYSPSADKVILRLLNKDGNAIIEVEDFGIGIEPAEHDKIFQNFYRVKGKDEQTFAGFGIGLYLVTEILKGHGGNIHVSSERNKGSLFTFTLPALNN